MRTALLLIIAFLYCHVAAAAPGMHARTLLSHQTPIPTLAAKTVNYEYQHAIENVFDDRLEIMFRIFDEEVRTSSEKYFFYFDYVSLRRSKEKLQASIRVDMVDSESAIATIKNLEPRTAYEFHVSLWRMDGEDETQVTKVADLPTTYFGITGGYDDVENLRAVTMISAVAELHLWEMNYPQKRGRGYCPGGAWCNVFSDWNLHRTIDGKAMASSSLNEMIAYSKAGHAIHGNFLTVNGGSHYTLALAYDEDTDTVCTVDGNFNNRVVLCRYGRGSINRVWKFCEDCCLTRSSSKTDAGPQASPRPGDAG